MYIPQWGVVDTYSSPKGNFEPGWLDSPVWIRIRYTYKIFYMPDLPKCWCWVLIGAIGISSGFRIFQSCTFESVLAHLRTRNWLDFGLCLPTFTLGLHLRWQLPTHQD